MVRIDRCLIDANWGSSTDVVYQFCRQSPHASVLTPNSGLRRREQPALQRLQARGERVGLNWRVHGRPASEQCARALRHELLEVVRHAACRPDGRPGRAVAVHKPEAPPALEQHLTSEYRVRTEDGGRTVDEWKLRSKGLDNHWLDCMVGTRGGVDGGRCSSGPTPGGRGHG